MKSASISRAFLCLNIYLRKGSFLTGRSRIPQTTSRKRVDADRAKRDFPLSYVRNRNFIQQIDTWLQLDKEIRHQIKMRNSHDPQRNTITMLLPDAIRNNLIPTRINNFAETPHRMARHSCRFTRK